MAYTCELGSGQTIYVENIGEQTAVTLASSSAGQQQQAGSQFTTGAWTAPPEVFRTQQGVVIKLTTVQGTQHLQLQGNQLGMMSAHPSLTSAQQMPISSGASLPGNTMPPMQPMQPMQPMPPMQMGDMEMQANPMQMRMGNMAMQMGNGTASRSDSRSSSAAGQAKFCRQCGTPVQPSDRFCANCGHQLMS